MRCTGHRQGRSLRGESGGGCRELKSGGFGFGKSGFEEVAEAEPAGAGVDNCVEGGGAVKGPGEGAGGGQKAHTDVAPVPRDGDLVGGVAGQFGVLTGVAASPPGPGATEGSEGLVGVTVGFEEGFAEGVAVGV